MRYGTFRVAFVAAAQPRTFCCRSYTDYRYVRFTFAFAFCTLRCATHRTVEFVPVTHRPFILVPLRDFEHFVCLPVGAQLITLRCCCWRLLLHWATLLIVPLLHVTLRACVVVGAALILIYVGILLLRVCWVLRVDFVAVGVYFVTFVVVWAPFVVVDWLFVYYVYTFVTDCDYCTLPHTLYRITHTWFATPAPGLVGVTVVTFTRVTLLRYVGFCCNFERYRHTLIAPRATLPTR